MQNFAPHELVYYGALQVNNQTIIKQGRAWENIFTLNPILTF